jgi:type I restriction enzyme S subunit
LYSNALEQALFECGAPFSNLGSHVDQLVGYAFKSADFTENPADIRLMRGDNIVPGGIRWEGAKHWRADRVEGFERYILQPHDVLIAMDRTWIKAGIKFAVVSEQDTPSLLVQRVARLRAKPTILVDFLAALIRSRNFERYVLSIQTGTGVPHISGGQINAFPVRVPAIEVQAKIMERLNAIQSAAVEIADNIQSSASELDTLRQSLLQKAFSGELT